MRKLLGLTPGTPRLIAMRDTDEEDKLPAKTMLHTEVRLEHCCTLPNIADLIFAMQ